MLVKKAPGRRSSHATRVKRSWRAAGGPHSLKRWARMQLRTHGQGTALGFSLREWIQGKGLR
jgi:hypothetical protein